MATRKFCRAVEEDVRKWMATQHAAFVVTDLQKIIFKTIDFAEARQRDEIRFEVEGKFLRAGDFVQLGSDLGAPKRILLESQFGGVVGPHAIVRVSSPSAAYPNGVPVHLSGLRLPVGPAFMERRVLQFNRAVDDRRLPHPHNKGGGRRASPQWKPDYTGRRHGKGWGRRVNGKTERRRVDRRG